MSPLNPHLPVYADPSLKGQCRPLHLNPWNCKSFIAYNYIHTMPIQGRLNSDTGQYCTGSWSRQPVSGCDENGKYCARAGIEPTSLALQASALPCRLSDVTTLPTPTRLCSSFPERSVQTTTFLRILAYITASVLITRFNTCRILTDVVFQGQSE